jgi:hypothetical protein
MKNAVELLDRAMIREIIAKTIFNFIFYSLSVLTSAFFITFIWGLYLSDTGYQITYRNSVGFILILSNTMYTLKFLYDLDHKEEDK